MAVNVIVLYIAQHKKTKKTFLRQTLYLFFFYFCGELLLKLIF